MSPKVYIVQRPAQFCQVTRTWKDKYDMSAASAFGEVVYLLSPGNIKKENLEQDVSTINNKLRGFTGEDYLVVLGDPVASAVAIAAASRASGGVINILKFERRDNRYYPYLIKLP